VSARLTLVAQAPTAATNTARFAADEPLDEREAAWAAQGRGRLTRVSRVVCAPATACRQTAAALGLAAADEVRLRDWDLGVWRGCTLEQVAAAEPDAVAAWLGAPGQAPHGGEPLIELLDRVAAWLGTVPGDGHTVAVTPVAVVRAAVLATLCGAPAGFWRIDIAPLTATVLRGGPGRWTLRVAGAPLTDAASAEPATGLTGVGRAQDRVPRDRAARRAQCDGGEGERGAVPGPAARAGRRGSRIARRRRR
jgi:broad specificity phosphatase PhoE